MTPARRPRIVPDAYVLLSNWRYLEYAVFRIITGWGRCAGDWQDKLAVCYHAWLQADTVQRMRQRLVEFPGGRPDGPVHKIHEDLTNAVLLGPSFRDAMAGLYELLAPALERAYRRYAAQAHPVHDKPTLDLLQEVLALKAQQARWYVAFSRRHPHTMAPAYREAIAAQLARAGGLEQFLEPGEAPHAASTGVNTNFAMPITPGRVEHWDEAPNIMPLLQLDWSQSVEARRLFFMIGYFWEMGVAEQQLRWLYYADFMPWQFLYEEARHMWDESRHGNSGLTRLRDFGLDIRDVGYSSYGKHGAGLLPPLTPAELYEEFFQITQIAETGYFATKRYCLEDFAAGGDAASAEMMQFDIIDETSHAEYGRRWLEELARHAGVNEDYRARGAAIRAQRQKDSDARLAAMGHYAETGRLPEGYALTDAHFVGELSALRDERSRAHYERLFRIMRAKCPLTNNGPLRPNLPM